MAFKDLPFEYDARWPDLYESLLSGDEELARSVVGFLERRMGLASNDLVEIQRFLDLWIQSRDRTRSKDAVAVLEKRDRDLEDFLTAQGDVIIDFGDVIFVGPSKRYRVGTGAHLNQVVAHLSATGTTDTVMDIYKNTTVIGTLTIPAGDVEAQTDVGVAFGAGDYWQMRVTTASNGAGLVVQGSF